MNWYKTSVTSVSICSWWYFFSTYLEWRNGHCTFGTSMATHGRRKIQTHFPERKCWYLDSGLSYAFSSLVYAKAWHWTGCLQATGCINVDKGRPNTREYATHLVIFVDYFYFTNCFNHSSILVDFSTRFTTWGRRLVNNWHASNQTRKGPTMCYTSNFVFGLLHLTCT